MSLRPRFSLRTLLLLMILIASGGLLYQNWYPWRVVNILQGGNVPLHQLSFSADGTLLLAYELGKQEMGPARNVYVWEVASGRKLSDSKVDFGKRHVLTEVCFSANGAFVEIKGCPIYRTEKLIDTRTGDNVLKESESIVGEIEFSADEQFFCVRFRDGKRPPEIWDAVTRKRLSSLRADALDSLGSLVFLDSSVAIFFDPPVYFTFNAQTGEFVSRSTVLDPKYQTRAKLDNELASQLRHPILMSFPNCRAVSPDNKRVLTVNPLPTIQDAETAAVLATLQHPQSLSGDEAAGSPDLNYAATPGDNNTVLLWKRFRDEHLSSLLTLPEFWSTVVLLLVLMVSVVADVRSFRRTARTS